MEVVGINHEANENQRIIKRAADSPNHSASAKVKISVSDFDPNDTLELRKEADKPRAKRRCHGYDTLADLQDKTVRQEQVAAPDLQQWTRRQNAPSSM